LRAEIVMIHEHTGTGVDRILQLIVILSAMRKTLYVEAREPKMSRKDFGNLP
jgi:hypothetical protein